jgi:diguanylate cyclase (GGDEF)-like protein/PAS domain S-box-containing protein
VTYESRRRRSDGAERDLEVSLVPHRGADGRVIGVYALIHDITERKRAEEALRASAEELRLVADHVPAMIAYYDPRGRYLFANRRYAAFFGTSVERLRETTLQAFVGPHNWAEIEPRFAAAAGGQPVTYQRRHRLADGRECALEVSFVPRRDESGAVSGVYGLILDVTARVRYQQALERQANYDSLTGLPNRNLLGDRLDQAIAQAARAGETIALLYIDLDQVKRINDSLGHTMGDRVIAAIGARIAGALRGGDTAARVGGDEFVAVLAPVKRDDDAARVGQKLREAIARPLAIDGHEFVISASIGAALFPRDGADAATLLRNADAALYQAKSEGRDCLRYFTSEMNLRVVHHLEMEGALRRALEGGGPRGGELRLHYQPIVKLAARRRVVGAEALVRWSRPGIGIVPPAQFIPVAEDSGLIVPIGRWVLHQAIRQVRRWGRRGRASPYVSVNLSARQFRDPGLLEAVRGALREEGADARRVRLEITESIVMANPEEASRTLVALRALGVGIAVDDFGTGYSSLSYLKRFPLNSLKIDRSFVRDLPEDSDDLRISRAVIDLAHGLGLEVIAEGVETERQAAILARHGCDAAQGYLFGRPAEALALAARRRRR